MRQTPANDHVAAARAKRYDSVHTLKTAQEARRAGLGYDLAFAITEKESSGGHNVFGHDAVKAGQIVGGTVTRARYLRYKAMRKLGRGMQGVGPVQLTWYELQDEADRLGGCHLPRYNMRVGFRQLRGLIKAHGLHDGIALYNGTGPVAHAYARDVLEKRKKWHKRLNP